MSIAETVLEKLNALPPEKQAEVLRFVENVSSPIERSSKGADPYEWLTIAANMNLDVPRIGRRDLKNTWTEAALDLDDELFLDSAYLIALANPNDQLHRKALSLSEAVRRKGATSISNRAVLLEVGSGLSRVRFRASAIQLINAMMRAPSVEILPLSEELANAGWQLFCARSDKEWSWTDCVSFVNMRQRGIRQALTADEHFEQAGFVALLRH